MYKVYIPNGVVGGQQFHVQVNGQVMAVTCPPNMGPGQVLHIQVNQPQVQMAVAEPVHGAGLPYPGQGMSSSMPSMYAGTSMPMPSTTTSMPTMPMPPTSNTSTMPSSSSNSSFGKSLFVQGLDGGQQQEQQQQLHDAPPQASGRPIPGLNPAFRLPSAPGNMHDWRQTHALQIGEEYVLDGSVKSIKFGLGWDTGHDRPDIDGNCVLFDGHGQSCDVISYRQLKSRFKDAVEHSGDNRTGAGSGDDETIKIKLRKLPDHIMYAMCCVTIYTNHQFGSIRNLRVKLYHGSAKPKKKGKVLLHYDMSASRMGGRAMVVALLCRKGPWWAVKAVAQNCGMHNTMNEVLRHEHGLLSSLMHSCPCSLPPRFIVRISVMAAQGLASRDMNGKSDPFVKMEFRKHKHKGGVVRKTLNPQWTNADCATLQLHGIDMAEMKKVKITVWDWDRFTDPDFMGRVKIPACALINLGPGTHTISQPLQPYKKYPGYSIRGSIELHITVQPM